jgi:hypothetical protein
MRLSSAQQHLLRNMGNGDVLKVHRTVDGAKHFRLHPLAGGEPEEVQAATVETLQRAGLLESNLKFPAAVFLLTARGVALAAELTGKNVTPVGPRYKTTAN